MPVDVPPADQAIARGRRRRRARLQASTIAWTIALAAGFGTPQAAGSLAAGGSPGDGTLGTVTRSAGTAAPALTPTPTPAHGPRRIGNDTDSSPPVGVKHSVAPSRASSSDMAFGPSHSGTGPFRIALTVTPPGDGPLLLGLDAADHFVMARMGSASAPVPLPGLTAFAAAPPVLVTNPAGGWLVAVSGHSGRGSRPSRLAVVTTSGQSEPFGPKFARQSVASAAVSPNGTRVAVALTRPWGPVLLEILPLPGHGGVTRSWQVPPMTLVTALSWAPDGRHLSYIAGKQTAAGIAGGPVTLDTASRMTTAPTASDWPSAARTGAACVPDAVAWLGRGGAVRRARGVPGQRHRGGAARRSPHRGPGWPPGPSRKAGRMRSASARPERHRRPGSDQLLRHLPRQPRQADQGAARAHRSSAQRLATERLTTAVQVPNLRRRPAYDRSARRKSTFLKAGQ